MSERQRHLIDAEELAARLGAGEPPVLADCRFALGDAGAGERAYAEEHIPGAHYLHLERDLSGPRAALGGRHPLPDAEAFAAVMRRIGLGPGRLLVAYDDSRAAYASRLWWLARHFGHEAVRVLDGGWAAWRRAGLPVSADLPIAQAGRFVARPAPGCHVDFEAVAACKGDGSAILVDSREPRRYAGLEEPIDPVAGHIPGARNLPWSGATGADGCFLDTALQRQRWSAFPQARPLVVYCGSGVTACVNLLSLALAGREGALLYAGSWSDWCAREGAAVATGEN